MENSNIFFLICGKSGSGKSTIIKELEKTLNLKELNSYTTRPPRDLYEKGHMFLTKDKFDCLTNKVAYSKYNNFEYCATEEQVNNSDLLTIDPAGIKYFKQKYTGDKKIIIIYIDVNLNDRILRMKKRGDSADKILDRVIYDEVEFKNIENIATIKVYNNDLKETVIFLTKYIKSLYD